MARRAACRGVRDERVGVVARRARARAVERVAELRRAVRDRRALRAHARRRVLHGAVGDWRARGALARVRRVLHAQVDGGARCGVVWCGRVTLSLLLFVVDDD